jgi:uncharacterized membrane protein
MLDSLTSVASSTACAGQRQILVRQAEMIVRSAKVSVPEANDLIDIRDRYRRLIAIVDDAKSEGELHAYR